MTTGPPPAPTTGSAQGPATPADRARPSATEVLRAAAEHLVALAAVAVAVLPWTAVTEVRAARIAVLGAVVLSGIISVVAARLLRVRPATELLVSLPAALLFLLVVVVGDPLGVAELARGLRDGLPRILSTSLPILDATWVGVPGAVVAWTVAAVTTSMVARTRSIATPVALVSLALLSGYAVTLAGSGGDPLALAWTEALVVAALLGTLALLRTEQRVPAGQRLRAVGRIVLAVVVVLVGVGLSVLLVDRAPYLPEDPIAPTISSPADEREPVSPLLVTRNLRSDEPDRVIGQVALDGDGFAYVPLAVLDRFDGRVWSLTQASFAPTGGTLPVTLPVGGGATASFSGVDLDATGGWLPFVTRPSTVSGLPVLHNGGSALQLAEPVGDIDYQLQLAQPTRRLLDPDLEGSARVSRGAVQPLEVPDPSGERRPAGERLCRLLAVSRNPVAERAIDGEPCGERGPDTVEFLRELARTLEVGRSVPADLVGGLQLETGSESLSDLLDLVSQSGTEGAVGSPEQFAAAYALIAADYGLPVRVVTGFRVTDEGTVAEAELRGEQAWTWVEVPVTDVGWVVIDPSPATQEEVEEEEQEAPESAEEEAEVAEPERSVVGVDPTEVVGRAPAPEERGAWEYLLWAVGGVVLILVAVIAVADVRRRVRRQRRQQGDARQRVVGAWHEAIDALYDAGHTEVEALSATEFSGRVAERAPDVTESLPLFADAVNRAVFSSRPMEDAEADQWWTVVRQLRRGLRRSAPPLRRLAALFLPAPAGLSDPPPLRPDDTLLIPEDYSTRR